MLDALITPKAIAVVGASKTPGKVGHEILANLLKGGFCGPIYPVNPAATEILGVKCHADVKSLPGRIDLSIIAVPLAAVKDAVEGSLASGAEAICIISAGFKETGPDGAAREREIADIVKAGGARLLGPNCLGLINPHHHMNASFASKMPVPGGIAVFSQSGALCTAILDMAVSRHMGLSTLFSIGNKADICEVDLIAALARDPNTKVIAGYLENINFGAEFLKAAESAAAEKPVIILKAGTTQSGMKAASSHTGSLAGADVAYAAAFRRCGVVRADTFESLFDNALALAMQPMPAGDRIAIITNAGGPGIMAADAAERAGLKVTAPDPAIAAKLKESLPAAASVGNPIDVLGDADEERYRLALKAALADETIDAVIVLLTPQAMTKPVETAWAMVAESAGRTKPVLAAFMGGNDVHPGRVELAKGGIPDYPAPERAVQALRAMCDYAAWRRRPPRMVTRFPVNRHRVDRVIARHTKAGRYQMGEPAAKEVMRAYGFPVAPGRLAVSADDAIDVAVSIGFPVAMKIVSPDIIHKSEVGGVKLGLNDIDAVRDAYDLLMLRIERKVPDAKIEGVYIEKMFAKGREVIIGMSRDPYFGPMLMFGLGGIFVEVMKDVTFHLAPITAEEAMQMLRSTRSYALLRGARGQASVDLDAIANALQRISQLVTDYPEITELDINPFMVGAVGSESAVADARMTIRQPSEGGPAQ